MLEDPLSMISSNSLPTQLGGNAGPAISGADTSVHAIFENPFNVGSGSALSGAGSDNTMLILVLMAGLAVIALRK